MSAAEADSIRRAYLSRSGLPDAPCRIAEAYVLAYDLVNAHYHARPYDCPGLRRFETIRSWMAHNDEHEMARIGYPVARQNGIQELVPFDYQGTVQTGEFGNTRSGTSVTGSRGYRSGIFDSITRIFLWQK